MILRLLVLPKYFFRHTILRLLISGYVPANAAVILGEIAILAVIVLVGYERRDIAA
jgi:hypothetical protein